MSGRDAPAAPFGLLALWNPMLFWSATMLGAASRLAEPPARTCRGPKCGGHDLPVPEELSVGHDPELFA